MLLGQPALGRVPVDSWKAPADPVVAFHEHKGRSFPIAPLVEVREPPPVLAASIEEGRLSDGEESSVEEEEEAEGSWAGENFWANEHIGASWGSVS